MEGETSRRIAAIKFDSPATPKSVFGENLVQNSAASLYDFVRSMGGYGDSGHPSTIAEEGVLEEFEEYLEATRYYGPHVARRWAAELSSERVEEYARAVTGGRRVFRSVDAYLPIVVLDSELYAAQLDEDGVITRYEPRDCMATSVRVVGWASAASAPFALRTAEAVVTVANPAGLAAILPQVFDFFSAARDGLVSQGDESSNRAIFEHDFLSAVASHQVRPGSYRSDIDDLGW
jgi:hypothetical protein